MALLGYASIAGSPIAALGGDTIILTADAGAFIFTGQAAVPTPTIVAGSGSYILTGQDVLYGTITAETGQFVITGGEIRSYNLPAFKSLLESTVERGFEETLAAFAHQRRKDREELEIRQLMAWEARVVREAIQPFTVVNQ